MKKENEPSLINGNLNGQKDANMDTQYQHDVKDFLKTGKLQSQLETAVLLICQPHYDVLSEEEYKEMLTNLAKISEDKIKTPTTEIQELLQKQDSVVPFQTFFGLTNNALFSIYKLGYNYFQNQQYPEATDIFTFLVALNPTVADFCTALGLCYQQNERWEDALTFFTLASNLNSDHIAAHISAINCYKKFGNKEGARIHLKAIENICEERPEVAAPWRGIIDYFKEQIIL